jgi:DNA (cytosine-5)-methyltransferase 1
MSRKLKRKLVIDSFAGGGGASEGLVAAIGRAPDIAINHDAEALAMHKLNHPESMHVLEDVWKADLKKLVGRRSVGLLWASPDCRHFSRAKGGTPVSKRVRSLAWIVCKWAREVKPDVIMLENVREFAEWGPLVPRWECRNCEWKGTEGQVVHKPKSHRCPHCNSKRISPTENSIPCPKRKGLTFRRWRGQLQRLGYVVQHRTLNAADFGAPTDRKRLFLVARRDGKPIVWPQATHAAPSKLDRYALFERPLPHRTAAEIIDWDVPALSIFATPEQAAAWGKAHGRAAPKRPLKDKTLRRIALGIKRYVLDSPKPFIVQCDHGGEGFRGQSLERPLATVAGDHGFGLVTPFIAHAQNGSGERFRGQAVADPLATVTAKPEGGGFALVTPFLSKYHGQKGAESRCLPLDEPINVVDTQPRYGLVAPTLIQTGYGERAGQAPRVPGLDKPLGTIVTGQKHALVAATLAKFYGGVVGHAPDRPIGTITAADHHGLVSANLVKFRGDSDGQSLERPLPTITAGDGAARPAGAAHALGLAAACLCRFNHGDKQWSGIDEPLGTVTTQGKHFGLVVAFLAKYFGTGIGQPLDKPLGTLTTQDRYGVVQLTIEPGRVESAVAVDLPGRGQYVIADIALRMLRPRELARAQGFPDSYHLIGTTSSQVAKIGNSVPPALAQALAAANYAEAELSVCPN